MTLPAFAAVLFFRGPVLGQDPAAEWRQWRGPLSTGVSPRGNPPTTWSRDQHVRWQAHVPGLGHSTPIVVGDRIYITTAVPYGEPVGPFPSTAPGAHDNSPVTHHHRFVVLALRRSDGSMLWERVVRDELPHEQGHYTASLASSSPVADDQRVYAHFGSRGLYALNAQGEIVWQRDFGKMQSKHGHGEGSSVLLSGDKLIINWDHEGQSFIAALHKDTGQTLWEVQRNEETSWATPIVVEHDGRHLIIASGTKRVRAYDRDTGEVVWECAGLSSNVVASPVAGQGVVIVGSSYETRAMFAIRLDGSVGDITGSDQVVWTRDRATPYVPSPLLYDNILYFLRHYQGVLTRVRPATGEELPGPFRLGPLGDIYASPVAAAERVYITDLNGRTLVMSHGEVPRVLAVNDLQDTIAASAAIAGKELYLRGQQTLYCIAEP